MEQAPQEMDKAWGAAKTKRKLSEMHDKESLSEFVDTVIQRPMKRPGSSQEARAIYQIWSATQKRAICEQDPAMGEVLKQAGFRNWSKRSGLRTRETDDEEERPPAQRQRTNEKRCETWSRYGACAHQERCQCVSSHIEIPNRDTPELRLGAQQQKKFEVAHKDLQHIKQQWPEITIDEHDVSTNHITLIKDMRTEEERIEKWKAFYNELRSWRSKDDKYQPIHLDVAHRDPFEDQIDTYKEMTKRMVYVANIAPEGKTRSLREMKKTEQELNKIEIDKQNSWSTTTQNVTFMQKHDTNWAIVITATEEEAKAYVKQHHEKKCYLESDDGKSETVMVKAIHWDRADFNSLVPSKTTLDGTWRKRGHRRHTLTVKGCYIRDHENAPHMATYTSTNTIVIAHNKYNYAERKWTYAKKLGELGNPNENGDYQEFIIQSTSDDSMPESAKEIWDRVPEQEIDEIGRYHPHRIFLHQTTKPNTADADNFKYWLEKKDIQPKRITVDPVTRRAQITFYEKKDVETMMNEMPLTFRGHKWSGSRQWVTRDKLPMEGATTEA